jgi:SET domain-containing protein
MRRSRRYSRHSETTVPNDYPYHRNVIVRSAPPRGRGIVARRDFAKGEEIEAAPVIPISIEESRAIRIHPFANNVFDWIELPGGEWTLALVGGLAMMFNHSYTPNADYDRDYERMAIVFRAIQPIRAGDEVFINYNGHPEVQDPVWFDVT